MRQSWYQRRLVQLRTLSAANPNAWLIALSSSWLMIERTLLDWAWSIRFASADSATNFCPKSLVTPNVDI